MADWVAMGFGLIVLVTGGGVVAYARSLANASAPLERRTREAASFRNLLARREPSDTRVGDVTSVLWCGIGLLAAGVFLVIIGVVLQLGH